MVNYFAMDEKAKCRPNGLPVLASVACVSNRVFARKFARKRLLRRLCLFKQGCCAPEISETSSRSLIFMWVFLMVALFAELKWRRKGKKKIIITKWKREWEGKERRWSPIPSLNAWQTNPKGRLRGGYHIPSPLPNLSTILFLLRKLYKTPEKWL